jgi:Zn-dependent M28 family amino/carboxypeptidase
MLSRRALVCLFVFTGVLLQGQPRPAIEAHVRADMAFLASDALRGRGSATHDELVAATYVVSQFQSFGLESAQLQHVPLTRAARASVTGSANAPDRAPAAGSEGLPDSAFTYNAFAVLPGSDPALANQTILLSSHLDHLGVRRTRTGEVIYHGADDDASGTTAVLEIARALGSLPKRPRRTIVFVCFGSEETGGQGNEYFLRHPPVPLSSIVANLEFEMIGQLDRSIQPSQLWLTGWERSNLGPTLASHGAPLVADPHPSEHFFQRSDNIALARRGIVAQTVSSYGLGVHYHQPSDDLAHINFPHLSGAIQWMIPPIRWLADSDWKPSWNPGGKP